MTTRLPARLPWSFGAGLGDLTPYVAALFLSCPPWLLRARGGAVMRAFGEVLEAHADRAAESLRVRLPSSGREDALAPLGRGRRILRGPLESSESYARRLVAWLDSHRGRGGPYALLEQLAGYWSGSAVTQIELVYASGTRYTLPLGGAASKDAITWVVDGLGWAQLWVVLRTSASPGTLSADQQAAYLAVPREWSAAHVQRTTVVVMWGHGRLWDYPPPSGDWTAWETGMTWDAWDAEAPVALSHTEG